MGRSFYPDPDGVLRPMNRRELLLRAARRSVEDAIDNASAADYDIVEDAQALLDALDLATFDALPPTRRAIYERLAETETPAWRLVSAKPNVAD